MRDQTIPNLPSVNKPVTEVKTAFTEVELQEDVDFINGTGQFAKKSLVSETKYAIKKVDLVTEKSFRFPVNAFKLAEGSKVKESTCTLFVPEVNLEPKQDKSTKPKIPPDIKVLSSYITYFNKVVVEAENEYSEFEGLFPDKVQVNSVGMWVDTVQLVAPVSLTRILPIPQDQIFRFMAEPDYRQRPSRIEPEVDTTEVKILISKDDTLHHYEGIRPKEYSYNSGCKEIDNMNRCIDQHIYNSRFYEHSTAINAAIARDNPVEVELPTITWHEDEQAFAVFSKIKTGIESEGVFTETAETSCGVRRVVKPLEFRALWYGIVVRILLDTGATSNVVNKALIDANDIEEIKLKRPLHCSFANGTSTSITHETKEYLLTVDGKGLPFSGVITDIQGYDLIIGLAWLIQHQANLSFATPLTLTFYNKPGSKVENISWIAYERNDSPVTQEEINFVSMAETEEEMIEALSDPNAQFFVIRFKEEVDAEVVKSEASEGVPKPIFGKEFEERYKNISSHVSSSNVDINNIDTESITPEMEELLERWQRIITDKAREQLPTPRFNLGTPQHNINLKPSAEIPRYTGYTTSVGSAEIMQEMIQGFLDRGQISPSSSDFASPAILVKKPGGGWRLVIDYRKLNEATISKTTIPPTIKDLINRLHGADTFTVIDLFQGYYQVPVSEADREKTTFVFRDVQGKSRKYFWNVMPLGLSGAPSSF